MTKLEKNLLQLERREKIFRILGDIYKDIEMQGNRVKLLGMVMDIEEAEALASSLEVKWLAGESELTHVNIESELEEAKAKAKLSKRSK